MKYLKSKAFYKFLIPSLIGMCLFVVPLKYNGEYTIPVAIIANLMLKLIRPYSMLIINLLVTFSAVMTVLHKLFKFEKIKKALRLNAIFSPSLLWTVIRVIGAVFSNMLYFNIGPKYIISDLTGGLVINNLMPMLVCIFFLAGLLLSLLLDFGLLDFFGPLLTKIMRPVFNLPGRSAFDCIASWLGDGSVGVLLTSKQYEEGFYSKREATVIATTFSAVSITFNLVVISEVGLESMFLPFYLTVTFAGIIAAIIVPKLPPLSKVPDSYCVKRTITEDVPEHMSSFKYGLNLAIKKAENAPRVTAFFKNGFGTVLEMWLGTLPVILSLGTIALIIAEFTPVFKILGWVFVPLYKLLQIPEAVEASQTVLVGFADMFLPSVIASSFEHDITKFVVAATSVSQLIYMSEIGSIIMGSKIPVSFKNLFVIFIERTLVTLPVIAGIAHLLF